VTRAAVLAMVLLGAPAATPAQQPTTPTLQLALADLFESQPGHRAWADTGPRPHASGAQVLQPDTAAWRLPPPTPTPAITPSPTPVPLFGELNPRPLRPNLPGDIIPVSREGLNFRGLDMARPHPGHAMIRLSNPYTQLRLEYRLEPIDGGEPLVTIHPPRTEEQLAVPAGRWRLVWRAWRPDDATRATGTEYSVQTLQPAGIYEHLPAPRDEAGLLLRLRRPR
jgi:hypothetical protein